MVEAVAACGKNALSNFDLGKRLNKKLRKLLILFSEAIDDTSILHFTELSKKCTLKNVMFTSYLRYTDNILKVKPVFCAYCHFFNPYYKHH